MDIDKIQGKLDALVDSYGVRKPAKGELSFFRKRPEVAGMMTEDNKITLNPYSDNTPEEQRGVARNEALRIFMKLNSTQPDFELTPSQKSFFKGTEYENDELNAKRSTVARILTGDPSVGKVPPEQLEYAQQIADQIAAPNKTTMPPDYKAGGRVSLI